MPPPPKSLPAGVPAREAVSDIYSGVYDSLYPGDIWQAQMTAGAGPLYAFSQSRGELPLVTRTLYDLWRSQFASRLLVHYNEFARCAVENRRNYVVGSGFQVRSLPADESLDARVCAKQVAKFIELFEEANDLPTRQAECMERLDTDGEAFFRLFASEADGIPRVRAVEPEHVRSRTGDTNDPRDSFGVETDPADVETRTAYWVIENPTVSQDPKRVPETDIYHFRLNGRLNAKRGVPTFLPVEPNLRRCEDLLKSMTQIAKTRAKIAMVRKLATAQSATATALLERLTAKKETDVNGNTVNIEDFRPGTVLTAGPGNDYIFPEYRFGADDFVEVLQAELRAIASRLVMSEWMFTAVADAKYSNAFITEAPVLKAFTALQTYLHRGWVLGRVGCQRSIYWRAIKLAVGAGLLPRNTSLLVKLTAHGPSLEARDKKAEAETFALYQTNGWATRTQIQQKLDIDPDEYRKTKDAEDAGESDPATDPDPTREPTDGNGPPGKSSGSGGDLLPLPVREAFNSADHPRDDRGRFIPKAKIDEAKRDPKKAAELLASVTDPKERAKLERELGQKGPATDPTQKGQYGAWGRAMEEGKAWLDTTAASRAAHDERLRKLAKLGDVLDSSRDPATGEHDYLIVRPDGTREILSAAEVDAELAGGQKKPRRSPRPSVDSEGNAWARAKSGTVSAERQAEMREQARNPGNMTPEQVRQFAADLRLMTVAEIQSLRAAADSRYGNRKAILAERLLRKVRRRNDGERPAIDYKQDRPDHPMAKAIREDAFAAGVIQKLTAELGGLASLAATEKDLRKQYFDVESDAFALLNRITKAIKEKRSAKSIEGMKTAHAELAAKMDALRVRRDAALAASLELATKSRPALHAAIGVKTPATVNLIANPILTRYGRTPLEQKQSQVLMDANDFVSKIVEGESLPNLAGGHKFEVDVFMAEGRAFWTMLNGGRINAGQQFGDLKDSDALDSTRSARAREIMAHEIGHHLEEHVPGLRDKARKFLEYRLNGEQPVKLNTLPGATGYDPHEEGAKDNFDRAFPGTWAYYVGKKYSSGITEVISMGVEKLYTDPHGFAIADPEYFAFMVGALKGTQK